MAPHAPSAGQYLRSDSGGSEVPMLGDSPVPSPGPSPGLGPGPDGGPGAVRGQRRRCGPLWGTVAVMTILALQIASTTGLFVYFTMAISKMKSQAPGNTEELRCLQKLNQQPEGSSLEELSSSQTCLKLASTIKAYVSTVTENIILRSAVKEAQQSYFNTSKGQVPATSAGKPSAHLTLRLHNPTQDGHSGRFGNLSQSCRHAIPHWRHGTPRSHLRNFTYRAGRLRVEQPGKYYVYSQIYFRYRSASAQDSSPQLVQCIQWQQPHSQPILLLKGVDTKCWAPGADYGLHTLYQGGVFELKAGDELFVSVSSLAINDSDPETNYFGAFRLDP